MFQDSQNLKPVVKENLGYIDKWPTYLSPLPIKGSKDKKNKPTLLQNLEALLENELHKLNCCKSDPPSKKRLQAYQEVFEYLIKEFSTYKPLLSAIKQEYDAFLDFQESSLRDLDALKKTVMIINQECEMKIINLKQEEKKDLIILQDENENLKKKILSLKQEVDFLNLQVKKCQDDIAIEYGKYRDERDARKLLIQDLNDLKERRDKRSDSSEWVGASDEKVNDPTVLRFALRQVREDFNKNTLKLAEVLSSYGDVVPRRDYENLEIQLKELEVSFDLLKKDHALLLSEYDILVDVHKKDAELQVQYDLLHENATPRPSLDKYVLHVEGTLDHWIEQTEGKSTTDKVNMLFACVTGQDLSLNKSDKLMFQPKGNGDEVPPYLRSVQPVRNRCLCKRDLCIILKDVWAQKCLEEGTSPLLKRAHMSQFLYNYLKMRFQLDLLVTEWGYNIHDSCLRYMHDEKVKFFSDVLVSEADEDIYYVQLSELEELQNSLVLCDGTESGYIGKDDFCDCLTNYFPNYMIEDINTMMTCAEQQLGGLTNGEFLYKSLFNEDEEGNFGLFVNCITRLTKKYKKLLLDKVEAYFENKSHISPNQLLEAMQVIASETSDETVQHIIYFVFHTTTTNQLLENLEKNVMLKKLANSSIRCR